MSQNFRLIFADESGQQSAFDLSSATLQPVAASDINSFTAGETVLVLPAAAALPFMVELPFSDPVKISRVLPQFVADIYVDVGSDWLFSWRALPAASGETACRVSGLAFPPQFAPVIAAAGRGLRLAIPDLCLTAATPGSCVRLQTPVSEITAVFYEDCAVKRLFSSAAGLPVETLLAAEGIESLVVADLVSDPPALHGRLVSLLASEDENLDVSGFRQLRRQGLRRLAMMAGSAILLLLFFFWHFFIWLECRITEGAAQRTRNHMRQAFSAAFPGVPVVEPLTQVSRSISELEKRLKEAATLPRLPWIKLLQILPASGGGEAGVIRLNARDTGVRLNGLARNYAALETFRGRLDASGLFTKVNTVESRQAEGGISFVLEAAWKN
ncbi:MAG TPA: PilN domain-containing protein [Candidatus Ozemobacteraceae bacterium]|nr:PilN domain-containing protein [Candidatus Ozemobacteraceae bacterium]